MPEGKGEMPGSPETQKPKTQKPFQPSWIMGREDEFADMNPGLQLRVRQIHQAPGSIAGINYLERHYLALEEQVVEGKIPEDEAGIVLAKIVVRIEELESQHTSPVSSTSLDSEYLRRAAEASEATAKASKATAQKLREEEPEVERIPVPEKSEECLRVVMDRLFGLMGDQIANRKKADDEDFMNKYKAIESFIRRIPEKRGEKDEILSKYLFSRFPEGVFLKEKLTLFFEAVRNLTNRTVEILRAEGSLMKLGSEKSEIALAEKMILTFTDIWPGDWYVLTHTDEIFRGEIQRMPELKLDPQSAWKEWRDIGDSPYKREEDGKYYLEMILEGDKLIKKEDRKINPLNLAKGEDKYLTGTLASIYIDEQFEKKVRKEIAWKISGEKDTIKGARSEMLAWCFLRAGLTFDMWDRKRWKIKGDGGVRDLMWFPWKQIARMVVGRSGGGVFETAGSYWAYEGQSEKIKKEDALRLGEERAKEFEGILGRNERTRAVFLVKGDWKAPGTIIGDFWSSTFCEEKNRSFADVANNEGLKAIPFLKIEPSTSLQSSNEGGFYRGYFEYNIAMAKLAVDMFMNTGGGQGWKIEDFMSEKFWEGRYDTLYRLKDYCPAVLSNKKDTDKITQDIARTFARGIFWLGSYKSQPYKDFLGVPLPRKGIYTFEQFQSILSAIRMSGFLTKERYKGLLRDVQEFGFYTPARQPKEQRRR